MKLNYIKKKKDVIKITNQVDFTTKYIIEAHFKILGVVEKSDINCCHFDAII